MEQCVQVHPNLPKYPFSARVAFILRDMISKWWPRKWKGTFEILGNHFSPHPWGSPSLMVSDRTVCFGDHHGGPSFSGAGMLRIVLTSFLPDYLWAWVKFSAICKYRPVIFSLLWWLYADSYHRKTNSIPEIKSLSGGPVGLGIRKLSSLHAQAIGGRLWACLSGNL